MRSVSFLILILLTVAFTSAQAQEFDVTPDSTSGVGLPNETNIFRAFVVNRWDQENRVTWHLESDLPEGWAVQICQYSLFCWPFWITDETFIFAASSTDSILVEFITNETEGAGTATLTMVAEADEEIRHELTFTLRVGDEGVSPSQSGSTRVEFNLTGRALPGGMEASVLSLPSDADVTIALHDMLGRQVRLIGQGRFTAGEHYFSLGNLTLPTGVYILRASCAYGAACQRVTLFR